MATNFTTVINRTYKIGTKMHCTFAGILKWVFFILLLALAIWFVREELSKYFEKSTSFMVTTKEMKHMPVQVICFSPFAKLSVLESYDKSATLQDILWIPETIENISSWQDFENEVMYKIGRSFDLIMSVNQKGETDLKVNMTEGENIFDEFTITLYEVTTWGKGLCYQMQLPFIKKSLSFRDAHFSNFEFLVEKREKWSISRREKPRNREKLQYFKSQISKTISNYYF